MRTYKDHVTVVSGDIEFTADAELHAEPANNGQATWQGTITVADARQLHEFLGWHNGLLLMPTGREGDFIVDPDSPYTEGSSQMKIVGMGPEPF
jgi:hypothetical protein